MSMVHLPVRAIILDLGNVLLFYDEQIEQKRLAAMIGISVAQLLPPYRKNLSALQCGDIDGKTFIARICRSVHRPVPLRAAAFLGNMARTIVSQNRPMFALARKLRNRYLVAILSNTYHDHTRIYRKQSWIRNFDYVFFSNEHGLDKPNPAVFRFVARKLHVKPSECLYTDDKSGHIRGARTIGMRAVTFTSPMQFKRFLKRNGIHW